MDRSMVRLVNIALTAQTTRNMPQQSAIATSNGSEVFKTEITAAPSAGETRPRGPGPPHHIATAPRVQHLVQPAHQVGNALLAGRIVEDLVVGIGAEDQLRHRAGRGHELARAL